MVEKLEEFCTALPKPCEGIRVYIVPQEHCIYMHIYTSKSCYQGQIIKALEGFEEFKVLEVLNRPYSWWKNILKDKVGRVPENGTLPTHRGRQI